MQGWCGGRVSGVCGRGSVCVGRSVLYGNTACCKMLKAN